MSAAVWGRAGRAAGSAVTQPVQRRGTHRRSHAGAAMPHPSPVFLSPRKLLPAGQPRAAPGQALPRPQANVCAKMAFALLGFRPAAAPGRSARFSGVCSAHRLASAAGCGHCPVPSQHRAVPLTSPSPSLSPPAVSQPLRQLRSQPAPRPPPPPAASGAAGAGPPPPADVPPPAASGAASRRAAAARGASVVRRQDRPATRRLFTYICCALLAVAVAAFWAGDSFTGCWALLWLGLSYIGLLNC